MLWPLPSDAQQRIRLAANIVRLIREREALKQQLADMVRDLHESVEREGKLLARVRQLEDEANRREHPFETADRPVEV